MDDTNLQKQIDAINKKLDSILDEMEYQKRHRREMEDLKEDLMRVGKDLYDTSIIELEEVSDYLNTKDILYLVKYVLRNVKIITHSIQQLENIKDFLTDVSPLLRESFKDYMQKLDEFDRKGYFEFVKELSQVADHIVVSFSKEDVKNFGDNIATILNTIKNLTQPDMLHTINNALNVYKQLDIEVKKDVSLFGLLKQLNTPEVRRGLAFSIQFLKNLANQQTDEQKTGKSSSQIN